MKLQEKRMHQAQVFVKEGYQQYRIAEILGITDRTVRNYLGGHSPTPGPRKKRKSKLDHFKSHIRSVLEDEIQRKVVRRFETQAGYQAQVDWKILPKENWRGI